MTIGLLQLELMFLTTQSLKDKRSVLLRLKNLVRKKFNLAVAEIGLQDKLRSSLLGMVTLSSDAGIVQNLLNEAEQFIEASFDLQITGRKTEIF